ncbi:unnamed protein product [Caenorhabditis brenneri]
MAPSTSAQSSLKTVLLQRYGLGGSSQSLAVTKKSDSISKIDSKSLQAAKAKKEAAQKEKARLEAQRKERQERLQRQKEEAQRKVADRKMEFQDWKAQRRLAMLNEGSDAPKDLPREMELSKKKQRSRKTYSRR